MEQQQRELHIGVIEMFFLVYFFLPFFFYCETTLVHSGQFHQMLSHFLLQAN